MSPRTFRGADMFRQCGLLFAVVILAWGPLREVISAPRPEAEPPEVVSCSMEEVSVLNLTPWSHLMSGQMLLRSEDKPAPEVKAYPRLVSGRPIYGKVEFDYDPFNNTVQSYHLVVDESRGSSTGYDLIYFDADGDLNLRNDPPLHVARVFRHSDILKYVFQPVPVEFHYTSAPKSYRQALVLSLTGSPRGMSLSFAVPTVRRGRLTLGTRSMEVMLQQLPSITGRFDRPSTYLVLGQQWECLAHWRRVDGTLYAFSTTPQGERLYARPYTGPWGLLQIGDSNAPRSDLRIESGKLRSDRAVIDLNDCPVEGGGIKVPVGAYRVYRRVVVRAGALRVSLATDEAPAQETPPHESPVLFLKIAPDKPCLFGVGDKLQVLFEQPRETDHITAGQEVRISAKIRDPARDLLLVGLEDTQRTETVQRARGKPYQRYMSLTPRVVITDSAGKVSAQGTMPFG